MIGKRIFIPCLAVLAALLYSAAGQTHDSRPLFIEINEISDNMVRVAWKAPPSLGAGQAPRITFGSSSCMVRQASLIAGRLQGVSIYACAEGLTGTSVEIVYPLYNPSISTLIRVKFKSGQINRAVLEPSQTVWLIPDRETFLNVIKTYFIIGIRHIFGGIDHLLFLAGLLYISRTPRRVLITVTSFTIAHTATIFLAALNIIRVSIPAIETVIALSVVFLASEIARNNRESLTWRYPVLVAGGFGLVHGTGFAAALTEIGVPQSEKLSAILFFNLGVEAGQIVIIAIIFAGIYLITQYAGHLASRIKKYFPVRVGISYFLGVIAAFWFVERLITAL